MRCLLIDNNADQSLRIATLLRSIGLECSPGETPNGATKASSTEGLELVLLEASSSTKAMRYLQNLRPQNGSVCVPKFICYSDAPAVADMSACILAGATDYLVQPFERELLRFKLLQAGIALDTRPLTD